MPKKPTAPAEPTLQEQAGLPSNFVPIESAPIIPGVPNGPVAASGAPPLPPNMAPYFTGSIPPALQLSPDLINTQYAGPGTPSVRLMPVGAGGNPAIVAAVQSVIETSGLGQVNLTMPIQYKVSENGSNIVVTWKNVPATWALMGPPSTLAFATPYFNWTFNATGTELGGTSVNIGSSLPGWSASTFYAVGSLIHDSNGSVQRAIVAGTSGGAQPTWPTSPVGATTTDNTVTWEFVKYLISVGDTIILASNVGQSNSVVSVTDAQGNSWASYSGPTLEPTTSTYFNVWAAQATANLAYGSTLAVTLGWNSGQTYGLQFITVSNVGLPTIPAVNGFGTGNITTTVPSLLVTAEFTYTSNNNTIDPPFTIVTAPPNSGQAAQIAIDSGPAGTYIYNWVNAVSTPEFVSTIIAFPSISSGSGTPGQPYFRAILDSDLPSDVVTSVVSDVNITGSISGQELTLGWAGQLSIARGGTGTATPALTAGTNITITGSWPDYTINSTGGAPGGSTGQFQYNNSSAFAGAAELTLASGTVVVTAAATTTVPLVINGLTSQTADLLDFEINSAKVLSFNTQDAALITGDNTDRVFIWPAVNGSRTMVAGFTPFNSVDNLILGFGASGAQDFSGLQMVLQSSGSGWLGTGGLGAIFQCNVSTGWNIFASFSGLGLMHGTFDATPIVFQTDIGNGSGGVEVARFFSGGGMSVGSTATTNEGAGTINVATGLYLNGTAYTNPDYCFERHYTGKIERFIDNPGAKDYQPMTLDEMESYTKEHFQLPRVGKTKELFARADIVLEKLEEAYLFIFELNRRVKELEKRG